MSGHVLSASLINSDSYLIFMCLHSLVLEWYPQTLLRLPSRSRMSATAYGMLRMLIMQNLIIVSNSLCMYLTCTCMYNICTHKCYTHVPLYLSYSFFLILTLSLSLSLPLPSLSLHPSLSILGTYFALAARGWVSGP